MKRLFQLLLVLIVVSAAATVFFYAKVQESDRVLGAFLEDATRGVPRSDVDATALAIAREVHRRTDRVIRAEDLPLYEHLESASLFNVTTAVSLRHGVYGLHGHENVGPCGTMTRVTLEALHRLEIPARKLQLLPDEASGRGGHTMLEFQSGGRWVVLSPSDGAFVWRTWGGRIATVDEIRNDPKIFAQVFDRFPDYPYRFERTSHIRWAKLPGPIRGFFRAVLGQEGYDNALTPELYDRPRELFLWISLAALALSTLAALILLTATRKPEARAPGWSAAA